MALSEIKEILDCGHTATPTETGLGTGVAHATDGKTLCYECADKAQRADLATSKTFTAYLSSDGKHLTTWSGGILATILYSWERRVGFHGSKRTYFNAVDATGKHWHGTSPGRNMYARMRATKVKG
jgi:hypothetical protein